MKRYLLLILLLPFFNSSIAQSFKYTMIGITHQAHYADARTAHFKSSGKKNPFKCDSIYYAPNSPENVDSKTIYSKHNVKGHAGEIEKYYGEDGVWDLNNITYQEFNADDEINLSITKNLRRGNLINNSKRTYEFDAENKVISFNDFLWYKNAQKWNPKYKFTRSFDRDNHLKNEKFETWDEKNSDWRLSSNTAYKVVDGRTTESIVENYAIDEERLVRTQKIVFFYSNSEDSDSSYIYHLAEDKISWNLFARNYYPKDMTVSRLEYHSDKYIEASDSWDPAIKTIYEHDPITKRLKFLTTQISNEGKTDFYFNDRNEYFWSENSIKKRRLFRRLRLRKANRSKK